MYIDCKQYNYQEGKINCFTIKKFTSEIVC